MRFKRNWIFTALVIVLALVVAACGGKKSDNTTASNNTASNNQVASNTSSSTSTGSTSTGSGSGAASGEGQTIVISMEMMAYSPKEVVIPPGTTVRWVNNEPSAMPHDVVQGTVDELRDFLNGNHQPLFQSPVLNPGDYWEYTFTEEGEYIYGCTQLMHFLAGMTGKITVRAGAEVPQELVL